MALFVMACSQDKVDGVQPAVLKYKSRQHRALYREFFLGGSLGIHDALILSAKYGYLTVDHLIDNYDLLMNDSRAVELAESPEALRTLARALDGHDLVYVYGGALYRDVVKAGLAGLGFTGDVVEVVGPNRGCCDHFAALQDVFHSQSAEA